MSWANTSVKTSVHRPHPIPRLHPSTAAPKCCSRDDSCSMRAARFGDGRSWMRETEFWSRTTGIQEWCKIETTDFSKKPVIACIFRAKPIVLNCLEIKIDVGFLSHLRWNMHLMCWIFNFVVVAQPRTVFCRVTIQQLFFRAVSIGFLSCVGLYSRAAANGCIDRCVQREAWKLRGWNGATVEIGRCKHFNVETENLWPSSRCGAFMAGIFCVANAL